MQTEPRESVENKARIPRLYWIALITLGVLAFILLIFLFLRPSFKSMVKGIVKGQASFTEKNSNVWGEFPGVNNIEIITNITFLDHPNIRDSRFFIWHFKQ